MQATTTTTLLKLGLPRLLPRLLRSVPGLQRLQRLQRLQSLLVPSLRIPRVLGSGLRMMFVAFSRHPKSRSFAVKLQGA